MPVSTAFFILFFSRFRGSIFFAVIFAVVLPEIFKDRGRGAGFAIALPASFDRVRLSARFTIINAADWADMASAFPTLAFRVVYFIRFALAGWAAYCFDMTIVSGAAIRANARVIQRASWLMLGIG